MDERRVGRRKEDAGAISDSVGRTALFRSVISGVPSAIARSTAGRQDREGVQRTEIGLETWVMEIFARERSRTPHRARSDFVRDNSPSSHPRLTVEVVSCAAGCRRSWRAQSAKVDFPSTHKLFGSKPAQQRRPPHGHNGKRKGKINCLYTFDSGSIA